MGHDPFAVGEALVRRYLASLPGHDLDGVLGCFAPDGVISSPTYGIQPAATFYPGLFADSALTEIIDPQVFRSTAGPREWIAAFDYRWQRVGQALVNTRLIDRFVLTADGSAIASLEIANIGPRPVAT